MHCWRLHGEPFPQVEFARDQGKFCWGEFGLCRNVRGKFEGCRGVTVRLGGEKDKMAGGVFNKVRRLADERNG